MPWSGPAASTEGRNPGEEQGWQRELTAVPQLAQTLRARCRPGTPWHGEAPDADAPAAATLLTFSWHGGIRAGQQPPIAGCQGAGGALCAATWVGCRSAEVPHSSPCGNQCGMGRNISQHEPFLPHVRATAEGRILYQPLSWCKSTSTTLTSLQAPPWDVEASDKGTF